MNEDLSSDNFESGDRLHFAKKCTNVSRSIEELFTNIRHLEDFSSDESDFEEEEVLNIDIFSQDHESFGKHHVQFSENMGQNSAETEAPEKPLYDRRGRSTSHHEKLSRTSSVRDVINRIFHRSRSTTHSPLVNQQGPSTSQQREESTKPKKKKRFFKRTAKKAEESKVSSIEVQEGENMPAETKNKLISRFFGHTKTKHNVDTEFEEDKGITFEPRKASRISLGGVRNSLMNLFRRGVTT